MPVLVSALQKLVDNLDEFDRLMEIHENEGGTGKGRRRQLEVLNKAAIVLVCAYWEAFCEDTVAEALNYILERTVDPNRLPDELKRKVAVELKKAPHEHEVWKLAGDGWKQVLSERMERFTEERNRKLNTPKTDQIDALFKETLGIDGVSSSWKIAKSMTVERAKKKLDKFIELRGSIAHRGSHKTSVRKADAISFADHILSLAGATNTRVEAEIEKVIAIEPSPSGVVYDPLKITIVPAE